MPIHSSKSYLWPACRRKESGDTCVKCNGISKEHASMVCVHQYNQAISQSERAGYELAKSLHHRNIVKFYSCELAKPCSCERQVSCPMLSDGAVRSVQRGSKNKIALKKGKAAESQAIIDGVEQEFKVGSYAPSPSGKIQHDLPQSCISTRDNKGPDAREFNTEELSSQRNSKEIIVTEQCLNSVKDVILTRDKKGPDAREFNTEEFSSQRNSKDIIVTEQCLNSVKDVLDQHPCGLIASDIVNIMKDTASAIKYLQSANIVHKRISPENIKHCVDQKTGETCYKLDGFGHAVKTGRVLSVGCNTDGKCGSSKCSNIEDMFSVSSEVSDLPKLTKTLYEICVGRFALTHKLPRLCPFRSAETEPMVTPEDEVNDWLRDGLSQNYLLSPWMRKKLYQILINLQDSTKTVDEKFTLFFSHVNDLSSFVEICISSVVSGECSSVYVMEKSNGATLYEAILEELNITQAYILLPNGHPIDIYRKTQICNMNKFLISNGVCAEYPLIIVAPEEDGLNKIDQSHANQQSNGIKNVIQQEASLPEKVGIAVSRVMGVVQSMRCKLCNISQLCTSVCHAYNELKIQFQFLQKVSRQCRIKCYNILQEIDQKCRLSQMIQGVSHYCLMKNFIQTQLKIFEHFVSQTSENINKEDPTASYFQNCICEAKCESRKAIGKAKSQCDYISCIQRDFIQQLDNSRTTGSSKLLHQISDKEKIVTEEASRVAAIHQNIYDIVTDIMKKFTERRQEIDDLFSIESDIGQIRDFISQYNYASTQ